MNVGRISTNYQFIRSMNSINSSYWNMDTLLEKMNTGKEVNRASDDPAAMQKILAFNTSIEETEQQQANISSAIGRLNATSTVLSRVEDIMSELIEITASSQATSATSTERAAQAKEVDMLLQELVDLANTQYQNKFLFGGVNTTSGTCALSQPFNIQTDADGVITGVIPNPRGINDIIYTEIMPNVDFPVNISGAAVFQPNGSGGLGDIFNIAIQLRDNLNSGDTDALLQRERELNNALVQVVDQNTIVGAYINRLEITDSTLEAMKTNEEEEKSQIEDADYSTIYMKYSTAELLLNTTLNATSTLLQTSLLNFI